jgi:hypothetical protein
MIDAAAARESGLVPMIERIRPPDGYCGKRKGSP